MVVRNDNLGRFVIQGKHKFQGEKIVEKHTCCFKLVHVEAGCAVVRVRLSVRPIDHGF